MNRNLVNGGLLCGIGSATAVLQVHVKMNTSIIASVVPT